MKKTKWFIGDDTSTEQLITTLDQLLRRRCLSLQQISDVTGASKARISSAIVRLQFTVPVRNAGTKRRALWFIPKA